MWHGYVPDAPARTGVSSSFCVGGCIWSKGDLMKHCVFRNCRKRCMHWFSSFAGFFSWSLCRRKWTRSFLLKSSPVTVPGSCRRASWGSRSRRQCWRDRETTSSAGTWRWGQTHGQGKDDQSATDPADLSSCVICEMSFDLVFVWYRTKGKHVEDNIHGSIKSTSTSVSSK